MIRLIVVATGWFVAFWCGFILYGKPYLYLVCPNKKVDTGLLVSIAIMFVQHHRRQCDAPGAPTVCSDTASALVGNSGSSAQITGLTGMALGPRGKYTSFQLLTMCPGYFQNKKSHKHLEDEAKNPWCPFYKTPQTSLKSYQHSLLVGHIHITSLSFLAPSRRPELLDLMSQCCGNHETPGPLVEIFHSSILIFWCSIMPDLMSPSHHHWNIILILWQYLYIESTLSSQTGKIPANTSCDQEKAQDHLRIQDLSQARRSSDHQRVHESVELEGLDNGSNGSWTQWVYA